MSYVATVVEVAVDDKGNFSIPRIDTAIDCGYAVNPDRIRSQIEGAAVMGLTLAKYGEITYKNGRVEQSNFHDFQLARINELPTETRVHIIEHGIRRARERRWRAWRAAVRAGTLQRDLRRHRQAYSSLADR